MATTSAHCVIECSDQPLDLSFHPTNPYLVAAGLVDGTVEVHDFEELQKDTQQPNRAASLIGNNDDDDDDDDEVDTIVSSTAVHTQILPSKKSESGMRPAVCRALLFSNDGNVLYTGGSGGDLVGLDASRICTFQGSGGKKSKPIQWRCQNATYGTSAGIQVIHEFKQQADAIINDNGITTVPAETPQEVPHNFSSLLATGDEVGGVRLWDTRLLSQHHQQQQATTASSSLKRPPGCIHSWKVHEDYISGLTNSEDGYTLLASSADCTVSVYDLRMAGQHNQPMDKIVQRSEDQKDELLSIQLMKNGRKLVCGSGEGLLSIFSWGFWGDASDRFPGHPASVDAVLPVDEDTVLTGSSDGLIRVVQIHPNKLLGILGDHEGFPIEKLRMNANQHFVGSVTHDQNLRIWDARILQDDGDDDDDDDDEMEGQQKEDGATVKASTDNTTLQHETNNSDGEWEDMDEDMEEDEEDDDDDTSDSEAENKPTTKNERRKNRFKTEQEEFYKDL